MFLNIEKFNGGFSVKLECSEGKVGWEQDYALKKIIPNVGQHVFYTPCTEEAEGGWEIQPLILSGRLL